MLLTALFIITLISLAFAMSSLCIAFYVTHVNGELRQQGERMAAGLKLHNEAMQAIADGMNVLNERQASCDTNIRKTADGLNALAKVKANDNIMMALAAIPSEMLPQA